MSTLLISIDRTSLSLAPLVLSGTNDANPVGVTGYKEPTIRPRITYAPDSAYEDDSTPLARVWQQTNLEFDISTTDAATEAASRLLVAAVREAVGQFPVFAVTVTVDGAPAETWTCHSGVVEPFSGRTFSDLLRHNPEWSVSIPAKAVRTIA